MICSLAQYIFVEMWSHFVQPIRGTKLALSDRALSAICSSNCRLKSGQGKLESKILSAAILRHSTTRHRASRVSRSSALLIFGRLLCRCAPFMAQKKKTQRFKHAPCFHSLVASVHVHNLITGTGTRHEALGALSDVCLKQ